MSFSQQSNTGSEGVPHTGTGSANPIVNDLPASNPHASSTPFQGQGNPAPRPQGDVSSGHLAAPQIPPSIQRRWGELPYCTDRPIFTAESGLMPPPATVHHRNQTNTATYHQDATMGHQNQDPSQAQPMAKPTPIPQQQDAREQVGMAANVTGHADQILGTYRALPQAGLAQQSTPSSMLPVHGTQGTGASYIENNPPTANTTFLTQGSQPLQRPEAFNPLSTSATSQFHPMETSTAIPALAAQTVFPCSHCFQSFPTQLDLRIHEKEVHQIWWCTVPGCKRDKPMVNKHSVTRHVRDMHEKAAKPAKLAPKIPTAEEDAAAMASYLAGEPQKHPAGSVLPHRKRQRTEDPPAARDSEGDAERITNLEAENARLNGLLRKFAKEVNTLRAEVESKEQKRVERENQDYDALSRGFSNEMNALIGGGGGPGGIEALRAEIKARHDRQMKEAVERHEERERRLWDLLKPRD